MYDYFYNFLLDKKKKKEKIVVFSFTDCLNLNIIKKEKIDILRFDINEFAISYGYTDIKKIKDQDILPLLKNLNCFFNGEQNKFFAVDVPLNVFFSDSISYSLEKIIAFYNSSNAHAIVVKFDYIQGSDLINRLSKLKIPVIISVQYSSLNNKSFFNSLLELESTGAVAIILEGFDSSFTQKLRSDMAIPVISSDFSIKSDGIYLKYLSAFGIKESNNKKYLNLMELLKEGISDIMKDIIEL